MKTLVRKRVKSKTQDGRDRFGTIVRVVDHTCIIEWDDGGVCGTVLVAYIHRVII